MNNGNLFIGFVLGALTANALACCFAHHHKKIRKGMCCSSHHCNCNHCDCENNSCNMKGCTEELVEVVAGKADPKAQ